MQTFKILDINDQDQVCEFEQAFFQSFVNIDNKLIHKIWDWDFNQKRLKTRISYNQQIISTLRDEENQLVAALAANKSNPTQFSEFGFCIPAKHQNFTECLAAFVHPESHLSPYQYGKFIMFTIDTLFADVEHKYFTCGKRQLKLYQRFGFELLESKVIDGETRHFLYSNVQSKL